MGPPPAGLRDGEKRGDEMSKVDASPAGQQEIVQALMKEIGGMSLQEMVSRAVAEGARWGARESLRTLGQQLLNGNPGKAVVAPAAPQTVVAADKLPKNAKPERTKCPVPDCKEPGVRQYHNFCRKHYNSLSEAQIRELRAKQIQASKPPPRLVVKCPVPDCPNTGIRPLHNFCQEHFNSLPEGKRLSLRAKQLAAHRKMKKLEHEKAQAG